MKVLNLDKDFNPFGALPSDQLNFKSTLFSAGEPHIQILHEPGELMDVGILGVSAKVDSADKLMKVAIAVDALDRLTGQSVPISLFIPYLPGGRQDRVAHPGQALSAKVYADIINLMPLSYVYTLDPHSDVMPSHIRYIQIIPQQHLIQQAIDLKLIDEPMFLIVPDAGATKKADGLVEHFGKELFPEKIQCLKHRDPETGHLSGFEVLTDDLHQMPCIIADDICDGGGTFIGIAEELKKKNAGAITLLVSHGIFSHGTRKLADTFDQIICSDSFSQYDLDLPRNIHILAIENIVQTIVFI